MAWTAPRTWVAGETLTAALLNAHLRDNLDAAFPVGSLHWRMQAATTSETTIDGMLLEANAASVLRATYAALNTKLSGLSYPFGTADGTHMTLPDVQGRGLVAMASGGHADVNALGDSDGLAKTSRTPIVAVHTHTGPSHSHTGPTNTMTGATRDVASGSAFSVSDYQHTHAFTTAASGTGATGTGGGVAGNFVVVGVLGVKF